MDTVQRELRELIKRRNRFNYELFKPDPSAERVVEAYKRVQEQKALLKLLIP